MFPDKMTALLELKTAEKMNLCPWVEHVKNAAYAAQIIAENAGMNGEKAYVLGLLHDIGRRTGIAQVRHIIDGYDYAVSKGWDEVAKICITHSFPVKDVDADIGKKDITPEQYAFIKKYIEDIEYDDYDKLIILCDALADANGCCMGWKKFYLIFGLCDETFSINYAAEIPEDVDKGWFMLFVTLLNQIYWVTGATPGGIFGSLIQLNTEGLDFAMTALFVVIFVEQWLKEKSHISSLLGLGLSLAALLVFGADNFMVPAMLAILGVLTILRAPIDKRACPC